MNEDAKKKLLWNIAQNSFVKGEYNPQKQLSQIFIESYKLCNKPLWTKRNLFYWKIQLVPHSNHSLSRLQKLTSQWCIEQDSLFVLRSVQTHKNTVWAECSLCNFLILQQELRKVTFRF